MVGIDRKFVNVTTLSRLAIVVSARSLSVTEVLEKVLPRSYQST